jgi:hypothetical protein
MGFLGVLMTLQEDGTINLTQVGLIDWITGVLHQRGHYSNKWNSEFWMLLLAILT